MAELDFVRQIGNNKSIIFIEKMPARVFINADKVRGIYSAKIVTRKTDGNIKPGGPDVLIKSATGGSHYITREALMENFVLASGKKIKMAYLKNNKAYAVYGECNDSYKIFKLPDNCRGSLCGKEIAPGAYIVAKTDESGGIDANSFAVVTPAIFRKMFKIPMQDIIKRHMNGGTNKEMSNRVFNMQRGNMHRNSLGAQPIRLGDTPRIPVTMPAELPSIGDKTPHMSINKNKPINTTQVPAVNIQKRSGGFDRSGFGIPKSAVVQTGMTQTNQSEKTYPFKVTHRVISMNNKALLGFIIVDKKTGKNKQMSIDQVKVLCEKHMIENLMLVTKEGTSLKFLRGNGIRIESLPEVIA